MTDKTQKVVTKNDLMLELFYFSLVIFFYGTLDFPTSTCAQIFTLLFFVLTIHLPIYLPHVVIILIIIVKSYSMCI